MKTEQVDVVVLGAGVAGLSFAWQYSKNNKSVLVLEKEKEVGGLHRTFWYQGFGFDFSAHRFHSANLEVLKQIKSLMGKEFVKKDKLSRIYLFDRFLKYPFDLVELIRAMPRRQMIKSVFDFLVARVRFKMSRGKIRAKTYKDWFVGYFGEGLYQVMCEPYTQKFWKMNPKKISADWADQRFRTVKIRELITLLIRRVFFLQFTSGNQEENLYPDSGSFFYPRKGAGRIPERMSEEVVANDAKVITEVTVTRTRKRGRKRQVWFTDSSGRQRSVVCKHLVSTIPLHTIVNLMTTRIPRNVRSAMAKLRYMDIFFVNLIINKKNVSKDSWLYFADKEVVFNRMVEFKNWSKKMAIDKNKTGVCFDISVFEDSQENQMTDKALINRCVKDAEKLKLFKKHEVVDGFVVRVPFAYPVYDLGYAKKLQRIVGFVEKDGTVLCLGRTGLARYNNADGSIEMGFELANRFKEGKVGSMWGYQFSGVSL